MLIQSVLCTLLAIVSLVVVIVAGAKAKGGLTVKNWPGRLVIISVVVLMVAIVGCVFTWSAFSDQSSKEKLLADTVTRALQGKPDRLDVPVDGDHASGTAQKGGVSYQIKARFRMRINSTRQGWECEVQATPMP